MRATAFSYPVKHRKIRKISGARIPYGELKQGDALFGLTNGQFSCAELLAWILDYVGAADVYISTWSIGMSETTWLGEKLRDGTIRNLKILVDRSWPTRHEKFCVHLCEQVGADKIRLLRTHAKIMVVRNESWAVVVRGSLNLNPNPRLEHFDLDDSPELADWLIREVFIGAFEKLPDVLAGNAPANERHFRDMFGEDEPDESTEGEPFDPEKIMERLLQEIEEL